MDSAISSPTDWNSFVFILHVRNYLLYLNRLKSALYIKQCNDKLGGATIHEYIATTMNATETYMN